MRIDYVGDQEDTDAPNVTATVEGRTAPGERYIGSATVRIRSQDVGVSGTSLIEYRVDGGEWQTSRNTGGGDPFVASVPLGEPGTYAVEYRATDREGNTSEVGRTEVVVVPGASCTFDKSDEFDDGTIDTTRWTLRTGQGHQITETNGSLVLPVLWELDGTAAGPLSFAGQPLPSGDWSMTTRMTINNTTTWQSGGLYLWQSDDNFVKLGMTFHGPGRNFEVTSDNPPNGTREFSPNESAEGYGNTVWLRMIREGNTIRGQYAKDENGRPGEWVTHSGTRAVNTTPPREGAGVLGGVYAGGQQNAPWNLTAAFDFVHYTPDTADCADDLDAPSTTATINGEAPEPSYPGPVDVELSATDGDDEDASGVAYIEHRLGGTGDWTREQNTGGDDPFVVDVHVSQRGEQRLQYRAADENGNVGATKALEFTVGPGGATDVYASDSGGKSIWVPDALEVEFEEKVTWHFDGPAQGGSAGTAHNVYLVRPGDDPLTKGFQVGPAAVPPGGDPVEYTFDEQGTWTFYCNLHAVAAPGAGSWSGMVGTVEVAAPGPDVTAPSTTAAVSPAAAPDGTVAAPAKVTLSASDGTRVNASGVAALEYAIDRPLPSLPMIRVENKAGAEPFAHEFMVSGAGTHTIEYRAVDQEGNQEDVKTLTVTVAPAPGPGPDPGPGPSGGGPGPADGSKPALTAKPVRRKVTARRRAKQVTLGVRLRNTGTAATSGMRVCADLATKRFRKRLKVAGRKCRTTTVAAGQAKVVKFKVRIKPGARGKSTPVRIRVSGGNVPARSFTIAVRAKR
jgi:plastocyanin